MIKGKTTSVSEFRGYENLTEKVNYNRYTYINTITNKINIMKYEN